MSIDTAEMLSALTWDDIRHRLEDASYQLAKLDCTSLAGGIHGQLQAQRLVDEAVALLHDAQATEGEPSEAGQLVTSHLEACAAFFLADAAANSRRCRNHLDAALDVLRRMGRNPKS